MMTEKIRKSSLCGYTVILLLAAIQFQASVVSSTTTKAPSTVATSTKSSRNVNPLTESKLEKNCKALCEHCGCLGFYCGEECLCECNDDHSDTECIRTMQMNAKTLNLPFEIVIQGPSSNRFVRNAQQFEQKRDLLARSASASNQSPRNRRSNITIYKPSAKSANQRTVNALEKPSKASEQIRHKRSVEHLEWFNDFASSLVRPSPLGTRAQKQQRASAKPSAFKRQAELDEPARREPWFLEQAAARLTRPAPLKKEQLTRKNKKSSLFRKSTKSKASKEQSRREPEREIRPLRDALQVVERIPKVLQDTVSHLSSDPRTGDVFSLNMRNEDLPPKNDLQAEDRAPRRPSAAVRGFRRNEIIPEAVTLAAPMDLVPRVPLPVQRPGGLLLPWLRQRRLMRLQQAQGNL
ncbi:uncharacterized protein LOC6544434 [Drosophila erecta]|uniref:Uncharacterized protein n=1 Tax=Drosophila erecta TaxID=7220 RepID=B3NFF0_DROER|nr:uncharacterized protein LOC6544434 [Drosophila erecta]EDV50492.1 uncharacterized protein Dere_GG14975 [Drosophila erecta]